MGQAKKKQMECPVAGRRITPAECGENRISNYACPADCPQNPWSVANYDRGLEIYDRLMEKKMARLRDEQIARLGYWPAPPSAQRDGAVHVVDHFTGKFFRERDEQGLSFTDRWKAAGCEGLNNDQRIMFDAESKGYASVFEIQQVLDDRRVRAVDLTGGSGAPFLLVDRALAAKACRFTTCFGVLYECPLYHRLNGFVILVPEVSGLGGGEVAMEIVRHLGGPAATGKAREWMTENIERVANSLNAIGDARREAMFRNLDLARTKSVYELKHCSVDHFEKTMKSQPFLQLEEMNTEHEDDGFTAEWVWTTDDSASGIGRGVLGSVFLHEHGYVQLEATAAARRDELKARFEKLMGRKVRFNRERTDDLALQRADEHFRRYDPELVPESLLQNPDHFQVSCSQIPLPEGDLSKAEIERRIDAEFNRTYLDSPIPLLDGATPRQAAKKRALRPALVKLMKGFVRSHDENNLRRGGSTDINWMLEELGLGEINFPPPPLRQPAWPVDDEDVFEEEDELDDGPLHLLYYEEIDLRMQELDQDFSPGQLRQYFAEAYPEMNRLLLSYCEEHGLLDMQERLVDLAARVAAIYCDPESGTIPFFEPEMVEDLILNYFDIIRRGRSVPAEVEQPILLAYVFEQLAASLRFGKEDPHMSNMLLALTAFSESLSMAFDLAALSALGSG